MASVVKVEVSDCRFIIEVSNSRSNSERVVYPFQTSDFSCSLLNPSGFSSHFRHLKIIPQFLTMITVDAYDSEAIMLVFSPLDDNFTPVLRAPVDDTQELFGDSQTSDSRESKNEELDEHTISSQEEEMEPSLLTMKLKFDSVPDDM
ncbi:hypothetical protein L2E82_38178 [Cichorium intybus]|uniref:Uncharacterized protein n=1 Tax=Cichorium intybus TaxID=13427 RepID=A0ACB9AFL4_CICIN|nr:hypothetical protein L2E82_38178 [Cichorium intybus]